jgi:hypothetical protein
MDSNIHDFGRLVGHLVSDFCTKIVSIPMIQRVRTLGLGDVPMAEWQGVIKTQVHEFEGRGQGRHRRESPVED